MLRKGVTLKGLEVFEALAETGSVAGAAQRTGLSQPTVSQQMRNLETALGTELVDHGRRPMRLTAAGQGYLAHARSALGALRQGQADLSAMDLGHLEQLNLGVIDDFDHDLTPRLATILADRLSRSHLRLLTAPSLDITSAVQSGSLHIGIAATDGTPPADLVALPVARDPFVLVAPRSAGRNPAQLIAGLPFLAYTRDQLIAQMTSAHFTRVGLSPDARFEIGAHLALMTLVARGLGWAVTTPLGYMRAVRFHDAIAAHPLPFAPFARQIDVLSHPDWDPRVPRDIAATLRGLIDRQIIAPAVDRLPWLRGELRLLS